MSNCKNCEQCSGCEPANVADYVPTLEELYQPYFKLNKAFVGKVHKENGETTQSIFMLSEVLDSSEHGLIFVGYPRAQKDLKIRFLSKDCRPALNFERTRALVIPESEFDVTVERFLKENLTEKPKNVMFWYADQLSGGSVKATVEDPANESKFPNNFLKLLYLESLTNKYRETPYSTELTNQLCRAITYLKSYQNGDITCAVPSAIKEVVFPTLLTSGLYSKINSFIQAIHHTLEIQGHSGHTYPRAVREYSIILDALVNSTEAPELITWSTLRNWSGKNVDLFPAELEPKSIAFREVKSLTHREAKFLSLVLQTVLLGKSLVPLSLSDDEFMLVGDHIDKETGKRVQIHQNIYDSEVFKQTDRLDGKPYTRVLRFVDDSNISKFSPSFSTVESLVELKPYQHWGDSGIYVYLKYDREYEPGTFPDGSLVKYAYIPSKDVDLSVYDEVKHFDGKLYTIKDISQYGLQLAPFGFGKSKIISWDEFRQTGEINGFKYPVWQHLSEPFPPIEDDCED